MRHYEAPESVKYHGGYDPSDPPQEGVWCSKCEHWEDDCRCAPDYDPPLTPLMLTSPHGLEHPVTEMKRGKGLKYNYKSWSGAFKCPYCNHVRWANLNFLGHRGSIYCNGKVTKIQRVDRYNHYQTPEQLFIRSKKTSNNIQR